LEVVIQNVTEVGAKDSPHVGSGARGDCLTGLGQPIFENAVQQFHPVFGLPEVARPEAHDDFAPRLARKATSIAVYTTAARDVGQMWYSNDQARPQRLCRVA
jgi:hypothetical protein